MHKNILHQKAMYLSYANDNIGERNNKFDKDTNKTQIDYNSFNEKINSIIGVDEKIYGPFAPEDVVILPKLNADILIDKNKAKLVDIQ